MRAYSIYGLDSSGQWGFISLNAKISPGGFLQALCYDYEVAARFILDWYEEDSQAAVVYLAAFLSRAYDELEMEDWYLRRKYGIQGTFSAGRPSVARVAFERFCELLYECPPYVSSVLASSETSNRVRLLSPLANRFTCTQSLLRGKIWSPTKYAFENPHPIPHEVIIEFREKCRKEEEEARRREEEQRKIMLEERRLRKERKKRENALKNAERRKESQERKVYRNFFSKLNLLEQVDELIRRQDIHTKVFPFDPSLIDQSIISKLSEAQKMGLLERASMRWEEPWKKLSSRLRADDNSEEEGI